MKRTTCIILLLTGLSCVANAQIVITTPYEFAVGVSGGATFSSVTFNPKVLQSKNTGATFGFTGRMTMGKNVGLQLELNFAQQGWKEKYESPEETEQGEEFPTDPTKYHYARRLNYVQMPFYTRAQFGGNHVKWFVQAGPQIGYLLGESTRDNLNGATPGRENTQHNMPVQNKFEWGISGGGGIEMRTGIGFFVIEGRYLYSLGDIYHSRKEDPFPKSSSQVISAKISYLISITN